MKWKKIKIRDNLFQYLFKEDDNGEPNSLFVCIDDTRKKALILDTAFERLAKIVKKDLDEQAIQPELVILSHYHRIMQQGHRFSKVAVFMPASFMKIITATVNDGTRI